MEALEVAAVGGGVVAGRRATHDGEVRLVHELGRGDAAADRAGVIDQPRRLLGRPDAGGVTRPAPVAKEVTISAFTACAKSTTPFHCARDSTPLNPAGGAAGGVSARGKVCRVRPRPADADIGRPQRGGELAQARVAQVDGRPILVQVRVHSGRRVAARRRGRRCGLLDNVTGRRPVRFPEPPARDLDHFHVIRLVAVRDGTDARHRRRRHG